VTKVNKADGIVPAEGWIVRYRSLNPEVARFLPQYGEVFEKYVDRNGNSVVEVVNMLQPNTLSKANASALIEVEVVRPGQPSENMPELPLGRGSVQVTWTSADINLRVTGPEVAVPAQPLARSKAARRCSGPRWRMSIDCTVQRKTAKNVWSEAAR
jgi:hypothetical protein